MLDDLMFLRIATKPTLSVLKVSVNTIQREEVEVAMLSKSF